MRNTLRYDGIDYADSDIRSAQAAIDTSLNERTLDVDTMTATIDTSLVRRPANLVTSDGYQLVTSDGYNLRSAERIGSLASFAQDEPIYFLRGGSQYALWYLKEVTRVAPYQWTLSMMSSLGRLTQMAHKGGIYNGVAASTIIADICGVVPHYVAPAFANVLLYGYLPYVSPSGENGAMTGSAKDNLLKVLFALNATVRDDANGTLRIENLSTAVSSTVDADRIYRDNAVVRHEPPITSVTVLEHQYISGGDEATLFEGTTTEGQVIVFSQPMSNLTATGFTITESGANYAVVSAGTGTLTGQRYIHTTREITRTVATAAIPNPARIEDATLVGITNSSDVANRLADYYAHRTYIECDAVIDFEDAGDVVSLYDPFDKIQRDACIEKISPLVVSQTMKGRISALVGFTPWQVVPFEDVRELLTGSGTWPSAEADIPDGTVINVALIGHGEPGAAGADGEDGITHSHITATGTRDSFSLSAKDGGAGGEGGDGGAGGKIYRMTFTYHTGDRFPFETSDPDTTFGLWSSSSGAVSDAGYTDPTTGDVYAQRGDKGIDGGAGGRGADRYVNGSPGEDVESWTGGWGGTGGRTWSGSWGEAGSGNGGGGGAAYGSNGGDAPDVSADGTGNVNNNHGGVGANATAPAAETSIGKGGRGGNGGGGGGGTGCRFSTSTTTNGVWYTPDAAQGGSGSAGGAGAPGCIILNYRVPAEESA